MNGLQIRYDSLLQTWKDGYGGEVKRSGIAFLILIFLTCGVCLALPQMREQLVAWIQGLFSGLPVTDSSGKLSAIALLSYNMRACVFIMLYGLVPFLQLSALSLGANAMLLGILAAQSLADGAFLPFLASVLPHGIFELPALILAFAMGLYVCGQLTRRCRHDETALSIWACLSQISWLLFLVLIPLLAVAALVEAHMTPLLVSALT